MRDLVHDVDVEALVVGRLRRTRTARTGCPSRPSACPPGSSGGASEWSRCCCRRRRIRAPPATRGERRATATISGLCLPTHPSASSPRSRDTAACRESPAPRRLLPDAPLDSGAWPSRPQAARPIWTRCVHTRRDTRAASTSPATRAAAAAARRSLEAIGDAGAGAGHPCAHPGHRRGPRADAVPAGAGAGRRGLGRAADLVPDQRRLAGQPRGLPGARAAGERRRRAAQRALEHDRRADPVGAAARRSWRPSSTRSCGIAHCLTPEALDARARRDARRRRRDRRSRRPTSARSPTCAG